MSAMMPSTTIRRLLSWLSLALTVRKAASQGNAYNRRAEICDDGVTRGYGVLENLILDVDEERNRVVAGGQPFTEYFFTLCPITIYDAEENQIVSALDNMQIGCGEAPSPSSNGCLIINGDIQVSIQDFADTNFPVTSFQMNGLQFGTFTSAAISGSAGDSLSVTLFDVKFSDFTSQYVIQQQTEDGAPFQVQMFSSIITEGTANTIFVNDGGILTLQDIEISDLGAEAGGAQLISTSGVDAATFLRRVEVKDSDVETLFTAIQGANLDVQELTVSDMRSFKRIFNIEGLLPIDQPASQLNLRQSIITGNSFSGLENEWFGVEANDNAAVVISDTTVSFNAGIKHLFSATRNTNMQLDSVHVIDSNGGLAIDAEMITAVSFANTDSTIQWTDSRIENVNDFTAAFFMIFDSSLQSQRVCMIGGNLQVPVFISNDSTYAIDQNYIENVDSIACPDTGLRLAQDQPGSGCFQGGEVCVFECETFATATECSITSDPPTLAPITGAPTEAASRTDSPTAGSTTDTPTSSPGSSTIVTSPNSGDKAPGDSETVLPFTREPGSSVASYRYQEIHPASSFPQESIFIRSISYRYTSAFQGETLPDSNIITISLNTRTEDTLSNTFIDNRGSDQVLVFTGSGITLPPGSTTNPFEFTLMFQFDQEFEYDPSVGNLVIEILNENMQETSTAISIDASTEFGGNTRLNSADISSPAGELLGNVLVSQFAIVPQAVTSAPTQEGSLETSFPTSAPTPSGSIIITNPPTLAGSSTETPTTTGNQQTPPPTIVTSDPPSSVPTEPGDPTSLPPIASPTIAPSPLTQPPTSETQSPSTSPSTAPSPLTQVPTSETQVPTLVDTLQPSGMPSQLPTFVGTSAPTSEDQFPPTPEPTIEPSSGAPTSPAPTVTQAPTSSPTNTPGPTVTGAPTPLPTQAPTLSRATTEPSSGPTAEPSSGAPTSPAPTMTQAPTTSPTNTPGPTGTDAPTSAPTQEPSGFRTVGPTGSLSAPPTMEPTSLPLPLPTSHPSTVPTIPPTVLFQTAQPTRCRERPPPGKGKGKGAGSSKKSGKKSMSKKASAKKSKKHMHKHKHHSQYAMHQIYGHLKRHPERSGQRRALKMRNQGRTGKGTIDLSIYYNNRNSEPSDKGEDLPWCDEVEIPLVPLPRPTQPLPLPIHPPVPPSKGKGKGTVPPSKRKGKGTSNKGKGKGASKKGKRRGLVDHEPKVSLNDSFDSEFLEMLSIERNEEHHSSSG